MAINNYKCIINLIIRVMKHFILVFAAFSLIISCIGCEVEPERQTINLKNWASPTLDGDINIGLAHNQGLTYVLGDFDSTWLDSSCLSYYNRIRSRTRQFIMDGADSMDVPFSETAFNTSFDAAFNGLVYRDTNDIAVESYINNYIDTCSLGVGQKAYLEKTMGVFVLPTVALALDSLDNLIEQFYQDSILGEEEPYLVSFFMSVARNSIEFWDSVYAGMGVRAKGKHSSMYWDPNKAKKAMDDIAAVIDMGMAGELTGSVDMYLNAIGAAVCGSGLSGTPWSGTTGLRSQLGGWLGDRLKDLWRVIGNLNSGGSGKWSGWGPPCPGSHLAWQWIPGDQYGFGRWSYTWTPC